MAARLAWGFVASALLCAGCETAPPPSPPPQPGALPIAPSPPPQPELYAKEGRASWYGDKHHGQQTASGEVYDKNALTAAHRTLPFGTRVRVTNLENSQSVELTVTDRGPYVRNRLIDVSEAAAKQLGFTKDGVARVRVQELP